MKKLILTKFHLLPAFHNTGISDIQIGHFRTRLHPYYFYADLVIYAGNNICKILKEPFPTLSYIRREDLDTFTEGMDEVFQIEQSQINISSF